MKNTTFKKAFNDLVQCTLDRIERDAGEHIYFENNPADPTLPHIMLDVNSARLKEFSWLQYSKGIKHLTKEEIEKIVSLATPTSKNWSETHKQVICTTIPCPCCNTISMFVKISSFGRNYNVPEESIDGFYRILIDLSDNEIKVRTCKFEETPVAEKIIKK